MTDAGQNEVEQSLLIDLVLGRCDPARRLEILQRLERDEALRRRHRDIVRTFAALDLAGLVEPPEGLVAATMARVRSARQTDALLARQELGRRDVIRPTFSLRELAAIAAVVLLLVSVFAASFRQAQRRKEIQQCSAQTARIGSALLAYANSNGGYLPGAGLPGRNWLGTGTQPAVSNSIGLFRLVKGGYESPVTFQCPGVGGGSFIVRADMTDFPSGRFVSYSYQYSLGPSGVWIEDRRLSAVRKSMAILADSNPLFLNGRFRRDRVQAAGSDNHKGAGQNVLYLDMHAAFETRPSVGVGGDNIFLAQGVDDYDGDEAPSGPLDSFLLPACSEPAGALSQVQMAPPQSQP